MLEDPFKNPFQEQGSNQDSLAQELEKRFIESLNKRLCEIEPRSTYFIHEDGRKVALKRAYVADHNFKTPLSRHDISVVILEFFQDKENKFRNLILSIDYLDQTIFLRYNKLIEQLEGLAHMPLTEKEKLPIFVDLDNKRRSAHLEAARKIKQKLESQAFLGKVIIDERTTKKLFEVLYRIWDTPRNNQELTYSEGGLDDLNLDNLKEDVRRRVGVNINVRFFTYGWHENRPQNQYTVSFSSPLHPNIIKSVEEIIAYHILNKTPQPYK